MRRALRWAIAAPLIAAAAGCATAPPVPRAAEDAGAPRVVAAAAMARKGQALVGASRAEAAAALGPATVLRFDSGYEVWVTRFAETVPRGRARDAAERELSELVVLVTPAGTVAKARVRSAPSP